MNWSDHVDGRRLAAVALLLCCLLAPATAVAGSAQATTLALSADVSFGTPGANGTATYELRNTGEADAVGVALNVSLPDGWAVVAQNSSEGTWRSTSTEWFWLEVPPGERRTASLRFRVPENATGERTVAARLTDGRGATATANATGTPVPAGTADGTAKGGDDTGDGTDGADGSADGGDDGDGSTDGGDSRNGDGGDADSEGSGGSGPGFGVPAALLSGLLFAAWRRARRRRR